MQPQQIQDPAAALVELQQQFELQAQELERIRKEKEDAQLAAQMQTQAALNTAGPSSGKVEGVRPPAAWNPKELSWTQYSVTLMVFLFNCVTDRTQWGLRALTFLPVAAQQAFVSWVRIPLADFNTSNITWQIVCKFCEQHQVAHLDTNYAIRESLFQKVKQQHPVTGVVTPLADHLAKIEALFVKCTEQLDPASRVYAV